MMQPHMFGFVPQEEDWEDEEETFDLSGWMSRSMDGIGDINEAELNPHFHQAVEEPEVRPRARPRGQSNTQASATFTPPMQNISGVSSVASKASPFNPLWVADGALLPKATLGVKVTGFAALLVGGLVTGGKMVQLRADKNTSGLGETLRDSLSRESGFSGLLTTVGLFAYLHPVLGWNEGILKNASSGKKQTAIKAVTHAVGLGTLVYLIKRR